MTTVVALGTVDTLTEYALQVMNTAADSLVGTLGGVPDSVYMDSGSQPAYDCCPALIVYVDTIAEASTAPLVPIEQTALRVELGAIVLATYVIDILRCAANPGPNGSAPSNEAKIEVAMITQQDVSAIWNGLRNATRNGDIFELCQGVHFDPCRPIRESGGCVGWQLQIRAMLPGIIV